jgi:serine/threonine protein phosphatase PrpC
MYTCSEKEVNEGDIVVLACDGLFDVMPLERLDKMVREGIAADDDLDQLAEKLTKVAIDELGSDDNVSVIIVVV